MKDKISKPQFIQIQRNLNRSKIAHSSSTFINAWADELALCLKWIDSGIHLIEVKQSHLLPDQPQAIHLPYVSTVVHLLPFKYRLVLLLSNIVDTYANNSFIECLVSKQELKYSFLNLQEDFHLI